MEDILKTFLVNRVNRNVSDAVVERMSEDKVCPFFHRILCVVLVTDLLVSRFVIYIRKTLFSVNIHGR